jgi:hypothetical protein
MKNFYTLIALFFITPMIAQDLVLTVEVPSGTTQCRLSGPWWGWNPAGGPVGVDNGNDTFTFTLPGVAADMEYLYTLDGISYENLIDNASGGECGDRVTNGNMITDYFGYANRIWKVSDGYTWTETYDDCRYGILSTDKFDLLKFALVPNPTTNIVKVSSAEIGTQLSIYDLKGRLVINKRINNTNEDVRVNHLNSGMYIARLQLGNKTATRKLIIN